MRTDTRPRLKSRRRGQEVQTVLLSVLAAAGTWLTLRDQPLRRQVAAVIAVGLVIVPMIAWYSGYWPMMTWFADGWVSVRGYPPLSFPISIVSTDNPVLDQFAYRVVLGWPDGLVLFQFPWEHADADFSRIQRTFCQGVLGAWDALAFSLAAFAFIGLGRRRISAAIGGAGTSEDPALKRR